jgi:dihydroneopterin aldolase
MATMIGTTGLKALRVDCIVGIYEHERQASQTVILDIEFDYDFAAAAASEAIADAVDYDHVVGVVKELLVRRQFQLIETMAMETADTLLHRLPSVLRVRLKIGKPAAVPDAACSFASFERIRACRPPPACP